MKAKIKYILNQTFVQYVARGHSLYYFPDAERRTMIYKNDDPGFENAMDKAIMEDYESGIVAAKCEFCGESIFEGEEYYSNGDVELCGPCYCDFAKIW